MKDTRKKREMLVVVGSAAIGALLGDFYLKPALNRFFGVKG